MLVKPVVGLCKWLVHHESVGELDARVGLSIVREGMVWKPQKSVEEPAEKLCSGSSGVPTFCERIIFLDLCGLLLGWCGCKSIFSYGKV